MGKHTPTPWEAIGSSVYDADGFRLADTSCIPIHKDYDGKKHWAHSPGVAYRDRTEEQKEELARLIASTPEMREALEDFTITDCEACEGTGAEGADVERGDACYQCAGYGKTIRGGDPNIILALLSRLNGEGSR